MKQILAYRMEDREMGGAVVPQAVKRKASDAWKHPGYTGVAYANVNWTRP